MTPADERPLPPETELLLLRAQQAVHAAQQLLAEGDVAGAARRVYQAMADGVAALLPVEDRERAR